MHQVKKTIISILVFILVWQFITSLNIYSSYLLPSPFEVYKAFIKVIKNGLLFKHIYSSLTRVFIGYIISFILAFILGLVNLFFKNIFAYISWIIKFFKTIPPLSLIPLIILWYGIGETSKIIIIVLASFFPMYLSIEKGLTGVEKGLLDVGKAFNLSKSRIFFEIRLPRAIPDILVGARVGMGYSFRAIIGAEMIAASSGLGYLINFSKSMLQTDLVLVGILVIGLLGFLSDEIFKILINYYLKDIKGNGWN